MSDITVNWTLTPNQRSELLNALLLIQKMRRKESAYSDLSNISTLISLTASLKCGDPSCSFCGDASLLTSLEYDG